MDAFGPYTKLAQSYYKGGKVHLWNPHSQRTACGRAKGNLGTYRTACNSMDELLAIHPICERCQKRVARTFAPRHTQTQEDTMDTSAISEAVAAAHLYNPFVVGTPERRAFKGYVRNALETDSLHGWVKEEAAYYGLEALTGRIVAAAEYHAECESESYTTPDPDEGAERVAELEAQVASLQEEVAQLERMNDARREDQASLLNRARTAEARIERMHAEWDRQVAQLEAKNGYLAARLAELVEAPEDPEDPEEEPQTPPYPFRAYRITDAGPGNVQIHNANTGERCTIVASTGVARTWIEHYGGQEVQ